MKKIRVTCLFLIVLLLSLFNTDRSITSSITGYAQPENPLKLVSQINLPVSSIGQGFGGARFIVHACGIWGDGQTKVAVSAGEFVHVIDLTDPQKPFIKTLQVPGESWDLKIEGNLMYVAMNFSTDGSTLKIYDISDVRNPQLKGSLRANNYAGAHNVFVRGKVAFLAAFSAAGSPSQGLSPGRGFMHIADISDPAKPLYLGSVEDPAAPGAIRNVHDMTVVGNRAYLAAWNTGFWILDFENLDDPKKGVTWKVVGHVNYKSAEDSEEPFTSHTHNVWPSPDGKILFTTDEVSGDYLRSWDISDLKNIKPLGAFRLNNVEIAHNVVVDGSYAYVAYYTAGVRVLDYSDPTQLKEIAGVDTDPTPVEALLELFDGIWSVFPFGKYVLAGDMQSGLLVFEKQGVLAGK